jgi:Putative transposase, YhgA-like
MAEHDHGYKLLFSHPRMVEDLVRGFVPGAWVAELDFASLERVPAGYVGEELEGRASDLVWRVRWRGESWVYVYLLIEFQSTVDRFMALRVLTYVGLLCQEVVRQGGLSAEGKLPSVLPIVLYNGRERWTAVEEVADLFAPAPEELAAHLPRLRYLLLDEGRYPPGELERLPNLAAALFRLEQSRGVGDSRQALATLAGRLGRQPEDAGLRRAFFTWVRRVLRPAGRGGLPLEDREEDPMLEESIRQWAEELKEEGLAQGRVEGERRGEAALLLRMLERKFGPLDEVTRRRIEAASPDRLLDWGERFVTAERLEDVFGA